MIAIVKYVWGAIKTVFMIACWGAVGAYRRTAPYARYYLLALGITAGVLLTIIPVLVLIKIVTGWFWVGFVATALAVLFTLILGLLWSPLAIIIGMLQGSMASPLQAGERYLRRVGVILFVELMVSAYVLVVPFHQNVGNIPLFLLAAAAFALGSMIWGGWLSGKFFTRIALLMILVLTASFFLPRTFHKIGQAAAAIDENIAKPTIPPTQIDYPICPGQVIQVFMLDSTNTMVTVPIRDGCWSATVELPRDYYKKWKWEFVAAGHGVEFQFYNGKRVYLAPNQNQ